MQWRLQKDPLSYSGAAFRQLEIRDLKHHGHRLQNENAADEWQQKLLLRKNGNSSESSADRKRADIAHEYLGGRGIEP